jgi:hypothetical protein
MKGSLRQRGVASWELRVYAGTDPDTHGRRYRTATVRGNRVDAERGLAELIAEVRSERAIGAGSKVSELLEAWFAAAAVSWAPTTVRQTRSVLDRYLHPHLGADLVGEVTPATIDAVYAKLRVCGSRRGTKSRWRPDETGYRSGCTLQTQPAAGPSFPRRATPRHSSIRGFENGESACSAGALPPPHSAAGSFIFIGAPKACLRRVYSHTNGARANAVSGTCARGSRWMQESRVAGAPVAPP